MASAWVGGVGVVCGGGQANEDSVKKCYEYDFDADTW